MKSETWSFCPETCAASGFAVLEPECADRIIVGNDPVNYTDKRGLYRSHLLNLYRVRGGIPHQDRMDEIIKCLVKSECLRKECIKGQTSSIEIDPNLQTAPSVATFPSCGLCNEASEGYKWLCFDSPDLPTGYPNCDFLDTDIESKPYE